MGTVVQLLAHLQVCKEAYKHPPTHTHTHNLTDIPQHTNPAFEVKAEAKKLMTQKNYPSVLQNNNRRSTELICIKTCIICNPPWVHRQSTITGNTAPSLSATELHRKSVQLL